MTEVHTYRFGPRVLVHQHPRGCRWVSYPLASLGLALSLWNGVADLGTTFGFTGLVACLWAGEFTRRRAERAELTIEEQRELEEERQQRIRELEEELYLPSRKQFRRELMRAKNGYYSYKYPRPYRKW
jgi:hypothetical protein